MPKFTNTERTLIRSIVASLSIKRIPESEIIKEIFQQTNKTITKASLFNVKDRIKRVPSLNESATNTGVDKRDEIAIKMKFGKAYRPFESLDFAIYNLKDQNFVVSDDSQICPEQNCEFQFKDTKLAYQPSSNDITITDGTMKVDTGDVTKIKKFNMTIHPTEARERNGIKTETVVGTFSVGEDPGIVYNVNGTIESEKGGKTLSLQGVQCNGNYNVPIGCNY